MSYDAIYARNFVLHLSTKAQIIAAVWQEDILMLLFWGSVQIKETGSFWRFINFVVVLLSSFARLCKRKIKVTSLDRAEVPWLPLGSDAACLYFVPDACQPKPFLREQRRLICLLLLFSKCIRASNIYTCIWSGVDEHSISFMYHMLRKLTCARLTDLHGSNTALEPWLRWRLRVLKESVSKYQLFTNKKIKGLGSQRGPLVVHNVWILNII